MRVRRRLFALIICAAPNAAAAATFDVSGYADLRLVSFSDEVGATEGGLGKVRFTDLDGRDVGVRFGEAVAEGRIELAPGFIAAATIRAEPEQRTPIDLLEAYLAYRGAMDDGTKWSVKAGAFYPPVSLENTDVGWTSGWTLTPSAINSWVGEELRTIGAEGKVDWRLDDVTLEALGALFASNDAAGKLVSDRGWILTDRPTGLFDKTRLPDAIPLDHGNDPPEFTNLFTEIDDAPGWYAGAALAQDGVGRIEILRYDNSADPSAYRRRYAWETDFWSVGARTQIAGLTLLAQAMTGRTAIWYEPDERRFSDFSAAYILAGIRAGDWRFAARADAFATEETEQEWDIDHFDDEKGEYGEHGHAFTLAAIWTPNNWLGLTTEALYVRSYRRQREEVNETPRQNELQIQQAVRVYF